MHFIRRISPSFAAAVAVFLLASPQARAGERQLQLQWAQLAPEITGRNIATVLTDGTQVTGKVIAVQAEGLTVKVKQSSAPNRFTGNAAVPRELVSFLRVSKAGWKWRVIGPFAGFFVGAGTGLGIGVAADSLEAAAFGTLAGAGIGAGLGYVLGDHADRHTTTISITK